MYNPIHAPEYLYNNTRVRTTTTTDDRVSRSVRDRQHNQRVVANIKINIGVGGLHGNQFTKNRPAKIS